jgi:hypothetical protein
MSFGVVVGFGGCLAWKTMFKRHSVSSSSSSSLVVLSGVFLVVGGGVLLVLVLSGGGVEVVWAGVVV